MAVYKKELGQFFTKTDVVETVIDLCMLNDISSCDIIDPMCGTGNMLKAAIQRGANASRVYGIEIDMDIAEECSKNIDVGVTILNKNSFDLFESKGYCKQKDLVLANPPYIRYQSISELNEKYKLSYCNVKSNLIKCINSIEELDSKERELLVKTTNEYSGLADLSIPSWILCMALTKSGGKLVIILPESWMTRDYATETIVAFLKAFKLNYIIEDVDRNLFEDALVKTNILIATKRNSIIEIDDNLSDDYKLIKRKDDIISESNAETVSINNVLCSALRNKNRLKSLELHLSEGNRKSILIKSLLDKCGVVKKCNDMESVDYYGLKIYQGLRTGANKFFYINSVNSDGEAEKVEVSRCWNMEDFKIPTKYLKHVIRNQADIKTDTLYVEKAKTSGRVLFLNDVLKKQQDMNIDDLYNYIEVAEKKKIIVSGKEKLVKELSAVKTNENNKSGQVRKWYMLPKFQERHVPVLFIPRINQQKSIFYKCENGLIIDANFSTITIDAKLRKYENAFLAILNSNWVCVQIEDMATVLGGGALKVEATQLKNILLPVLNENDLKHLGILGKALCETNMNIDLVIKQINIYLLKKIFDAENVDMIDASINKYIKSKIKNRGE